MASARPFKIWNQDRSIKKSIIASCLEELKVKGKDKLCILPTEPVTVVLEDDGTEIDDDDYFTFLAHNTTLILLRSNQKWLPKGSESSAGHDEPDFMIVNPEQVPEKTQQLISGLQKDISRIITFSNDDLQVVVECNLDVLAHLLNDTETYAKAVQDACQRHLDERLQTTEALDLLRLYHTARQCSPYVGDGSDAKKQKFSNT